MLHVLCHELGTCERLPRISCCLPASRAPDQQAAPRSKKNELCNRGKQEPGVRCLLLCAWSKAHEVMMPLKELS